MAQLQEIIEKFCEPNEKLREFLPAPFFFLNNDLPDDEIEWVMDNLAAQHFGGVFMHPRTGLEVEFLSDEFFERYEKFMLKCKEHNMDMWLYDEYNWPSGPVAGEFNRKYPEYLAKGLIYHKIPIKKGKKFEWKTDLVAEEFFFLTIIPSGSNAEVEKTLTLPPEEFRSANHLSRIKEWGIEYGEDKKSFVIKKPPSTGYIYVFNLNKDLGYQFSVLCSPKVRPSRGYIDPLNKDAVKKFIEMSYERFKEKMGQYFGKEIKGIFTDEPAFYAGMMYSPKLPRRFMQAYNYSFFNSLHLYFEDTDKSPMFKKDYHELVENQLRDNFSGELRYWCDQNNLALTGHLLMEENGYTNGVYLWGSAHKALSPFTIPGIDYLGDRLSPNFKKQDTIMGVTAKLLHSVQILTGAKQTLCEAFGGSGWSTDITTYKAGVNFLTIQGVNLINPHAVHFSIKGLRKRDFPNSYFVQQPYYPYFHHANDYTARAAYLNTIGIHDTKVLLLFPDIHQKIVNPLFNFEKEVKHCASGFYNILNFLLSSQFDPDLLFESTIFDKMVKSEELKPVVIGGEDYNAVFIPPLQYIRFETLEFLKKVFENGGKVFFIGRLPMGSERGKKDQKITSFYEEIFEEQIEILNNIKDAILRGNKSGGVFAYLPLKLPLTWQKILNQIKPIYQLENPRNLKSIQILSGDKPHKVFVSKRKLPDLNKNLYFVANLSNYTNNITFKCWDFGEIHRWDLNEGIRIPFNQYQAKNMEKSFMVTHSFGKGEMLVLEVDPTDEMMPGKLLELPKTVITLSKKWQISPQLLNSYLLEKWYYNPVPVDRWPKGRIVPAPTLSINNMFKVTKGWVSGVIKLIDFLLGGRNKKVRKVKVGKYAIPLGDLDLSIANKYVQMAFGRNILFFGSYGFLLELARPLLYYLNLEHFLGDLKLFYGREYICFTKFNVSDVPDILKLAYEDLGDPITIYINGKKLPKGDKEFVWDKCNRILDIKEYVIQGKNQIAIHTQKPNFTDWIPSIHAIEPVVLIGNFAVKKGKIVKPKSTLVSGLKDWKKYGFPNYSGGFTYVQKQLLDSPKVSQKVILELGDVRNMATVEVNGKDQGFIASPPWRIDITGAVIDGENSIKINVLNTCENLFGKPRKSGMFGKVQIKYIKRNN